jgi:hypothetical protein
MTHPSDFSLTVRHQLLENLATTGLLVPSVGFYGFTLLLGVPLAVLTQIYLLNEGRDDEDFIIRTIQQVNNQNQGSRTIQKIENSFWIFTEK